MMTNPTPKASHVRDDFFSALPHDPHNHYVLHAYAAIYRVMRLCHQSQLDEVAWVDLLNRFPVLTGYLPTMVQIMPVDITWTSGTEWWRSGILEWENKTPIHLPLKALAQNASFTFNERLALLLAALIDENWRFGELFASLQAPLESQRPTLDLIERLLGSDQPDPVDVFQFSPSRLISSGLLLVDDPSRPRSARTVQILPEIWEILRFGSASLAGWPLLLQPTADCKPLSACHLPESFLKKVAALPALCLEKQIDTIVIRGIPGSGRHELAKIIARSLGHDLLSIDLNSNKPRPPVIGPLCSLTKALPAFSLDLGPGETATLPSLDGYHGPRLVVLGLEGGLAETQGHAVTLKIPSLNRELRRQIWEENINPLTCPEIDAVTDQYLLPGGHIRSLARSTQTEAALGGRTEISLADVRIAARELNHQHLDTLASRLPAGGSLGDLVVNERTHNLIGELVRRCTHRETLAEGLGPAFHAPPRLGVRALFSGSSGTGKTLAARLLAASLGKDIYRADLASIVNKYIGETEKNLHRLLTHAEALDIILLFDEGDALLSGRTEVSSANDRYANLETNFLLQRLEHYQGIVIVTTNLGENIDSAFQRRMDVVIQFANPTAQERREILDAHLPLEHKVSDRLLTDIAVRCPLNGGQLRNISALATLLAVDLHQTVADGHLRQAVAGEYRKIGAVCPLDQIKSVETTLLPESAGQVAAFMDSFSK